MNKREFIEKEIAKNKNAYCRWYSRTKKGCAYKTKLLLEDPPNNELYEVTGKP